MADSSHHSPYSLDVANIVWGEDGSPRAGIYGDIYFSQESGIDESRHVFLSHNQLAERWQALDPNTAGQFTIVETGFGTGLNFLLTWQLWQTLAPASWRLNYVSVEKHPLRPQDLQRAHALWPELNSLASILQYNYPPLLSGQHRRMLNSAQVCLDLLFGDALDCLPALLDSPNSANPSSQSPSLGSVATVDAWFLDGFSPASNPEMWHDTLFSCMSALSKVGASFATFTSAGFVKRGLRAQGFHVEKVTGYGRKREMLRGTFTGEVALDAPLPLSVAVPWHRPSVQTPIKHVVIVGAGLAGCSTAAALVKRGLQVTVIDRDTPASGASGNPQGVLYTKLSPTPGELNVFTLHSFLFSLPYYRERLSAGSIQGELCGVLQLANSEKDAAQFDQLQETFKEQNWLQFKQGSELQEISGIPISGRGYYYPEAGWLSPPSICSADLDHPDIHLVSHCEAISLVDDAETWHIKDNSGNIIASGDAIIIANSNDAKQFPQTKHLPLKPIRGQLSYIEPSALNFEPKCVICHDGYLAPAINGSLCIGASFNLRDSNIDLQDRDHDWNLAQLETLSPALLNHPVTITGGRASLRCSSADYLPLVGAAPIVDDFKTSYAALGKDARHHINIPASNYRNVYVNVGHGSRGLTSTPLCAELLASYLCDEIRPLPRHLCESLSPARFLIRRLIRNQPLD